MTDQVDVTVSLTAVGYERVGSLVFVTELETGPILLDRFFSKPKRKCRLTKCSRCAGRHFNKCGDKNPVRYILKTFP